LGLPVGVSQGKKAREPVTNVSGACQNDKFVG